MKNYPRHNVYNFRATVLSAALSANVTAAGSADLSELDMLTLAAERIIPRGYWDSIKKDRKLGSGHWVWWAERSSGNISSNHVTPDDGNHRSLCGHNLLITAHHADVWHDEVGGGPVCGRCLEALAKKPILLRVMGDKFIRWTERMLDKQTGEIVKSMQEKRAAALRTDVIGG